MGRVVRLLDGLRPPTCTRSPVEAPAAKHEALIGRLVYLTTMVIGFGLLFSRIPIPYRGLRLWAASRLSLLLGLAIQITGLAFAIGRVASLAPTGQHA